MLCATNLRTSKMSPKARQVSTLACRVFEKNPSKNNKTALIMHGILGNKLNWRTFSQRLATAFPDWRFIALDHRAHGDSPSFHAPHDLSACSSDVIHLVDHLQVQPDAVFGHSFGGKVALKYLQECGYQGRKRPSQVWVLDALPGADEYTNRGLTASVQSILPKVKDIALPILSKAKLTEELQEKGLNQGEANWLTTNLKLIGTNPEKYVWKMDIDVIEQLFQSFLVEDFWPLLENVPQETQIHFVRAERNKMWSNEAVQELKGLSKSQNGRVQLHMLPQADHWVHIDNPTGLLQLIQKHFR